MEHSRIYYSIGEVADLLDINATTIRYWEKEFSIIKPHKNKKGNRQFSPADVENLRLIRHLLREKGMTREGARRLLNDQREETLRKFEATRALQAIREELLAIRKQIGREPRL